MRSYHAQTVVFALLLALLAPIDPARRTEAQGNNVVMVDDFGTGNRSTGHTATATIRRGVTSKVTIVKDFIDLVPFDQVSISGGGQLNRNSIANGRLQNGQGMGFISMDITVGSGQTVGSIITLKVGLIDQFKFRTVNRGEITAINKNADPTTIAAGTPWDAVIQGTDLGSVIVKPIQCHTIAHNGRSASGVTATITRNASCNVSNFGVALDGSATNDPESYNLTSGPTAGFQFSYLPSGVACVSAPNIGLPVIRQPQVSQVIVFQPGTRSPANVTISWDSLTNSSVAAPNNEWLVQIQVPRGPVIGRVPVATTVRGLSKSLAFAIPGTHTVSVRPKNCGQNAQSATVTFSTRY